MRSTITPGSIIGTFLVLETTEQREDRIIYQAYDTTSDIPLTIVQLVGEEDDSVLLQRASKIAASSAEPVSVLAKDGIIALVYGLPSAESLGAVPPPAVSEPPAASASVARRKQTVLAGLGPRTVRVSKKPKKHYGLIGAGVVLLLGGFFIIFQNKNDAVPPALSMPPLHGKSHDKKAKNAPAHKSEKKTGIVSVHKKESQSDKSEAVTKEDVFRRFNALVQRDDLHESTERIGREMEDVTQSMLERISSYRDDPDEWAKAVQEEGQQCVASFNDAKRRIDEMYKTAIDEVRGAAPHQDEQISADEWVSIQSDYCKALESERDEAIRVSVDKHADWLNNQVRQQAEEIKSRQRGSSSVVDDEDDDDDDDDDNNFGDAAEKLESTVEEILDTLEETKDEIIDSLDDATDCNASVWNKKVEQAKNKWSKAVKIASKKLKEAEQWFESSTDDKSLSADKKESIIQKQRKRCNDGMKKYSKQLTEEVRELEETHKEHLIDERRSRSEGTTNFPFRRPVFRRL